MNSHIRRYAIGAALATGADLGVLSGGLCHGPAPLSSLVPSGALLYVEAKNLSGLLKEWNATPEKAAWLKSDNYQVFSRSKLFTRLSQAQGPSSRPLRDSHPRWRTLENVAGGESALAIYDIGRTALRDGDAPGIGTHTAGGPLPRRVRHTRARNAAGVAYYVATAKDTGRVAAFALAGNLLVVGTREDLVAGTLRLVAGQTGCAASQGSMV